MDDLSASKTKAAKIEYKPKAMASTPSSLPGSLPKQTVNYDGTSYCKNKGPYAEKSRCKADISDCVFYKSMRGKRSNELVGVCRKRYDAKQKKKSAQAADIKKTQDIAAYNGRRT